MMLWGLISFVFILYLIKYIIKLFVRKCPSNELMTGKVVIVTGANAGIGFETAKNLAARGAKVILACRNEERATTARDKIVKETGNHDVVYKHLNLSSLDSIRKFAADVIKTESKLDVLINNAGVSGYSDKTSDGIIECMQINYFGLFLLTLLLLPLLKTSAPSRIINVSSLLYVLGELNIDKINKVGCYGDIRTYSNSKLCNILFSVELASRLQGTGVTVNAVHPGVIKTHIADNIDFVSKLLFDIICWFAKRPVEEGAQTTIYLAVAEHLSQISGNFYADCNEWYVLGKARDKVSACKLWEYSEKLVGWADESDKYITQK